LFFKIIFILVAIFSLKTFSAEGKKDIAKENQASLKQKQLEMIAKTKSKLRNK
jgi:hypothetical protein